MYRIQQVLNQEQYERALQEARVRRLTPSELNSIDRYRKNQYRILGRQGVPESISLGKGTFKSIKQMQVGNQFTPVTRSAGFTSPSFVQGDGQAAISKAKRTGKDQFVKQGGVTFKATPSGGFERVGKSKSERIFELKSRLRKEREDIEKSRQQVRQTAVLRPRMVDETPKTSLEKFAEAINAANIRMDQRAENLEGSKLNTFLKQTNNLLRLSPVGFRAAESMRRVITGFSPSGIRLFVDQFGRAAANQAFLAAAAIENVRAGQGKRFLQELKARRQQGKVAAQQAVDEALKSPETYVFAALARPATVKAIPRPFSKSLKVTTTTKKLPSRSGKANTIFINKRTRRFSVTDSAGKVVKTGKIGKATGLTKAKITKAIKKLAKQDKKATDIARIGKEIKQRPVTQKTKTNLKKAATVKKLKPSPQQQKLARSYGFKNVREAQIYQDLVIKSQGKGRVAKAAQRKLIRINNQIGKRAAKSAAIKSIEAELRSIRSAKVAPQAKQTRASKMAANLAKESLKRVQKEIRNLQEKRQSLSDYIRKRSRTRKQRRADLERSIKEANRIDDLIDAKLRRFRKEKGNLIKDPKILKAEKKSLLKKYREEAARLETEKIKNLRIEQGLKSLLGEKEKVLAKRKKGMSAKQRRAIKKREAQIAKEEAKIRSALEAKDSKPIQYGKFKKATERTRAQRRLDLERSIKEANRIDDLIERKLRGLKKQEKLVLKSKRVPKAEKKAIRKKFRQEAEKLLTEAIKNLRVEQGLKSLLGESEKATLKPKKGMSSNQLRRIAKWQLEIEAEMAKLRSALERNAEVVRKPVPFRKFKLTDIAELKKQRTATTKKISSLRKKEKAIRSARAAREKPIQQRLERKAQALRKKEQKAIARQETQAKRQGFKSAKEKEAFIRDSELARKGNVFARARLKILETKLSFRKSRAARANARAANLAIRQADRVIFKRQSRKKPTGMIKRKKKSSTPYESPRPDYKSSREVSRQRPPDFKSSREVSRQRPIEQKAVAQLKSQTKTTKAKAASRGKVRKVIRTSSKSVSILAKVGALSAINRLSGVSVAVFGKSGTRLDLSNPQSIAQAQNPKIIITADSASRINSAIDRALKPALAQAQSQAQATATPQTTIFKTTIRQTPRRKPPRKPPKKEPPKIPPIPKLEFEQYGRKRGAKSYYVQIKYRGKWKFATKKPLKYTKAVKVARYIVNHSAQASYRLVPSKAKPQKMRAIPSTASIFFRPSKRNNATTVEKSKYRINTRGEKRKITYVGIMRRLRRKSSGKKSNRRVRPSRRRRSRR